jgi:class 3 adenylate cyclase/energy-coupling factor transporter ATP-binding protein EcfA2
MMTTKAGSNTSDLRRLVTVLYANILGFSALADQLDPEVTSRLMRDLWDELKKIIEEYGGRIDKQLGDSFLVVWGTPETLEDDAERAVSASLALFDALENFKEGAEFPAAKALKMRIGVHTGLALIGDFGIEGEFTVLGDTVNISRHIEKFAEPDSSVITEATYQAIRGAFQVKRLPPVQIEGTQRLISIFRILEELPQPTKLRYRSSGGLETVLVGRENEMEQLASLFERTKEINQPQLVLVTGDVGVGKSRLLFEFAGWLETENPLLTVMSSRALDQTSRVPYYLWKELWSNRFELNEDDPPEVAQKKTIDGVLTLWGRALGEVTAVETAHFLGLLIGVEWDDSRYLDSYSAEPQVRIERSYELAAELLHRATQRGPVVLILDDLQWADPGSLKLIHYVWKSSGNNMPILILSCARSEFLKGHEEFAQDTEMIHLKPLPVSSEIVRKAYPVVQEVPEHILLALANQAKGNPYFMEELVKSVLASEDLSFSGDPAAMFPQSLEELLKSRLDHLSLEGRATAYFASIVGRVFWKGAVLAAFRGSPGITEALDVSSHNLVGKVQKALDELMEMELAFLRVGSAFAGDREYIFKHAYLREVAYQRVPEEHRAESHLAIAKWLDGRASPERSINVAHHYEMAGDFTNAQVFYTRAAEHARSIGNFEEADDLLYHARTLPESANNPGE